MKKSKLLYISNIAVPQQIKFANALQEFFFAKFWFYEYPDRTRGSWWRIDLGENCSVLKKVFFFKTGIIRERYYAQGLCEKLKSFDPDILIIGGLSIPSNYFAYKWAKKNRKKVVLFTERSRDLHGNLRDYGFSWKILRYLYKDLDMIMTASDDAVDQYKKTFGFGDIVVPGRYSSDLDGYINHAVRIKRDGYRYIFPNRLTKIYNPIMALKIFSVISKKYPNSSLKINAQGELRDDCNKFVRDNNLSNYVDFLDDIKSWSDLNSVYEESDIMLLPAIFSNGNFTIIEAMASGMGIVISNNVLGVGELIRDGFNGYNCDSTVECFVERIEKYINDPSLFGVHASINREISQPLGESGTAKYYYEILTKLV